MIGMILIPMNVFPFFLLILSKKSGFASSLFILDKPSIIAENSITGIIITINGANGLVI